MPELDTRSPFTRTQALAAGITPGALRGPGLAQLFRGVYLAAGVAFQPELRVRAALLTHPRDAFASHHSAAKVYGLPVPATSVEHVSIFDRSDRRRRDGIVGHVAAPQEVATVRRIRLSTPTQLFADLATYLDLVDLVVLGDAIVRRRLATPAQIVAACAARQGRSARKARRAAGYVRANVDSAMESRLRMLIVLAGLPEPEVNLELRNDSHILMCQLDLSYPGVKLAIEYDGQQHREDTTRWDNDIARGDWLARNGWRLLPVVSRGIYRRPDQTVERVHAALKQRGCPNLPRVLSDEWRVHFPVR